MAKYQEPEANEWVQPVRRGYKMACCDCGLVHEMDFRIYEGRVQFRARRAKASTAAIRKRTHKISKKSLEAIERANKLYAKALDNLAKL